MPLILRLLAWWIAFYRRWLSGRGPLRNVRCSFADEGGESCSAYGLRITHEAHSGWQALGAIRRRLARCCDACLVTDGRVLSWSRLHDHDPEVIAAQMRADGERPPAIARMLAARHAVARWRRDPAAARACRALVPAAGDGAPRLVSQPHVARRWERRAYVLGALGVIALVLLGFHPVVGGLALATITTGSISSASDAVERDRRFALHTRWAARR